MNIGIIILATNKYADFVPQLINSMRQNFLLGHKLTYFVFSDQNIQYNANIVKHYIPHVQWPYITLDRYKVITAFKHLFDDQDYLYYIDADMLVTNKIGEEILVDLVAITHPGFAGGRGTPETNPRSTAYVSPSTPLVYVMGAFQGGKKESFLAACKEMCDNIEFDKMNHHIAVWHDESHWNKYTTVNPSVKILPYGYCLAPELVRKGISRNVINPQMICLTK